MIVGNTFSWTISNSVYANMITAKNDFLTALALTNALSISLSYSLQVGTADVATYVVVITYVVPNT